MSEPTPTVFLSYAHEDTEVARRIADALRRHGIEAVFDKNELGGRDPREAKVRKHVQDCTLFLPVISVQTQAREKGHFLLEWRLAAERMRLLAEGVAFLVPVVIDGTPEAGARVPPEFLRGTWTRLPGGLPTPDFVAQLKRLLERPGVEEATVSRNAEPAVRQSADKNLPRKTGRRIPAVAWTLGLVVVVIALGVFWWRKPAAESDAGVGKAPVSREIPTAAAATAKSIAVLPFTNLGASEDNSFFTDGMQEDILANLALIRDFRVVSRASVLSYSSTTKTTPQIGAELGVTYVLQGNVQRAGNQVHVTGQLIKAATGEQVWAQTYDRDLSDIFGIQAELSQAIAAATKTVLSPEETALITQRPTGILAAYDLYLQARAVVRQDGLNATTRKKRVKLLEEAVELDPKFAQAWGDLADALAYGAFTEEADKAALLIQAKTAMNRALELAPDNPEVIGSHGIYYLYAYRNYARAVEQYQRLVGLQPNSAVPIYALALIQRRQGHWAEALANSRRAVQLDPANVGYQRNLQITLVAARRWDEAIATQRRIIALLPNKLNEVYQLAVLAFQATGSTEEGDAFFAGLSPEERDSPRGIYLRLTWAAETGNYAEAVRLDHLQPYFDEDAMPRALQAMNAASYYFALGDIATARARLGDLPARLRILLQREPGNLYYYGMLGGMEVILGQSKEGRRLVDRLVEQMPLSRDALEGAAYAHYRVATYDLAGDKEVALLEYQRLFRIPSTVMNNVHELKAGYSSLRGDSRFEAMIADPKNNAPLF